MYFSIILSVMHSNVQMCAHEKHVRINLLSYLIVRDPRSTAVSHHVETADQNDGDHEAAEQFVHRGIVDVLVHGATRDTAEDAANGHTREQRDVEVGHAAHDRRDRARGLKNKMMYSEL